jgi:AraC family transcriptional regulator of adaptative response / DNA-3-methyladenine glycosylase II
MTAEPRDASAALDFELCYRAVDSRDARFDGWFVTCVTSTGIYCRPSCPALTPKRRNVRFLPSAAAAQRAGFRACLRCRPDAAPGSPQWNYRADVAGRAMRLIADGVVDREGVPGLAARIGYTSRHLTRVLTQEFGAGPLALARAQRAQTARVLVETTSMGLAEIAFAAGFGSVRQFNDTLREVYGRAPSQLRAAATRSPAPMRDAGTGPRTVTAITVRLPYREPWHAASLLGFFGARTVAGLDEIDGSVYRRGLRLPYGPGLAELDLAQPVHGAGGTGYVRATLHLADLRDLAPAVARCRRLLDLDADPVAVDEALARDEALAAAVAKEPGVRVPGATDGFEIAVRAVVGQQISVAGARSVLGRLVTACAATPEDPATTVDNPADTGARAALIAFPGPEQVADAADDAFAMPASRRATVRALAAAVADGRVVLDPGADRAETMARLLEIPGVGAWTAQYITLRALADPDVLMTTDLGVRRGAGALGLPTDPRALHDHGQRWAPWRSYATVRLWRHA